MHDNDVYRYCQLIRTNWEKELYIYKRKYFCGKSLMEMFMFMEKFVLTNFNGMGSIL